MYSYTSSHPMVSSVVALKCGHLKVSIFPLLSGLQHCLCLVPWFYQLIHCSNVTWYPSLLLVCAYFKPPWWTVWVQCWHIMSWHGILDVNRSVRGWAKYHCHLRHNLIYSHLTLRTSSSRRKKQQHHFVVAPLAVHGVHVTLSHKITSEHAGNDIGEVVSQSPFLFGT